MRVPGLGRLRAVWRAVLGRPIYAPAPAPHPLEPQPAPPPPPPAPAEPVSPAVEAMMALVTDSNQPNINALWAAVKDLEAMRLNVKLLGYQLGLAHEYRLQAIPVEAPGRFLADCKPVTQGDMETRWFRYWCEQLRERPRYHRKLWEFAYIMQAVHAADALRPGARVLLLGDAFQPTASYAAAKGAEVVVAQAEDAPAPARRADPLFNADLVVWDLFDAKVMRRGVDFAALPADLSGFDACVVLGAATGRGSIQAGIDFAVEAMEVVRPSGILALVADFNYADDDRTIDHWGSVLFQRRHFEAIRRAWTEAGHAVAPLDFNVGYQALDRFIDIPPYDVSRTAAMADLWRDGWQAAHLKTTIDGFAVTSFGMVARRSRD